MKTCMQTFYINNKLQYDYNNRGYLNKINQVQETNNKFQLNSFEPVKCYPIPR